MSHVIPDPIRARGRLRAHILRIVEHDLGLYHVKIHFRSPLPTQTHVTSLTHVKIRYDTQSAVLYRTVYNGQRSKLDC